MSRIFSTTEGCGSIAFSIVEPIKTKLGEATAPLAHRIGVFAKSRDDLFVLLTVGGQKHDLRSSRKALRRLPTPNQAFQLAPLLHCQFNRNRRLTHRSCLKNIKDII